MKKILYWLFALLVIAGAGFGYYRYSQKNKPPDVTYKTANVEKRRITARVTATGTLTATVTVQVGTQISGRVQQLFADYNSQVKKGQTIAKIDPQLFLASAAQATANYSSAQAGVTRAQAQALDADQKLARAKKLNEQDLGSTADLEAAQSAAAVAKAGIDVAKAALEQARASLNQAQVNLSYTTIVSLIDGVVISRSVDVGQTVAASLQAPVLFTIAEDLRKMQLDTSVAEGDVGRLEPGMEAFFTVDAFPGQRFRGSIWQIRNAAKTVQNVVTYDAVINVENADLRLRPGMTASATVVFAERDGALALPNAALRFRPPPELAGSSGAASSERAPGSRPTSGHRREQGDAGAADVLGAAQSRTVWVLRGAVPESIPVKVGLSDGTVTEVFEGLKEGDAVVTDSVSAAKPPTGAPPGSPATRRMF